MTVPYTRTGLIFPPIPTTAFDYSCYVDATADEFSPTGYGSTRLKAFIDLMDNHVYIDMEEMHWKDLFDCYDTYVMWFEANLPMLRTIEQNAMAAEIWDWYVE